MTHDHYHVQEWNPKLKQVADGLMTEIYTAVPELKVLFMGSAALGLPGKNDVDLDILCNQIDVEHYARMLMPILGAPKEVKDGMVVWNYLREDIEIDCILSDPTTPNSHVPGQKKTFEKLKSSPELQERYKQLKYDCDGLPYAEYEARKKAFLQEVEPMQTTTA